TVVIATRSGKEISNKIAEKQRQSVFSLEGSAGYQALGTESLVKTDLVDVGAKSMELTSAAGFASGDTVSIVKTTNEHWVNKIGMAAYGWTPNQYQIDHIRVITRVVGNVIHFDVPMVDQLLSEDGGAKVMKISFPGRI